MTTYPVATGRSRRQRARKLSVSLPEELVEFVEQRAGRHGVAFSTELAAIVRRELDAETKERVEAALALDAEDNLRFTHGSAHMAAETLRSLEW